jgi:hypothetical protein
MSNTECSYEALVDRCKQLHALKPMHTRAVASFAARAWRTVARPEARDRSLYSRATVFRAQPAELSSMAALRRALSPDRIASQDGAFPALKPMEHRPVA